MNQFNNAPALVRSLITYAICVPLAMFIGYTLVNLTNTMDYQSFGIVGVLAAFLIFPLLMRWHYELLIFSWGAPISLFFLPGRPNLFTAMAVISLSISVVERILSRDRHFIPAPSVKWSLLVMLAVIYITAKLTGGFGLRSFGSDVFGGKKYVNLIIGILSFFALTARTIPKEKAIFYVALFCAGSFLNIFSDFYTLVPGPLHFIYLVLPGNPGTLDTLGNSNMDWTTSRLTGFSGTGYAMFTWMIFRYGVRGVFMAGKLWRPVIFTLSFVMVFLGGFRNNIIGCVEIFAALFFMERMYRTRLLLPLVMAGIVASAVLVPLASHLPVNFQRALSFLPVNISMEARLSADNSSEWRLAMWNALLPQIPEHLLLGKGYSFSSETYDEVMTKDNSFKVIDPAQQGLALASDFHSGPISVILPFGIWGVLAWLWFWAAGFHVLWRNYRYGDPAIQQLNRYLIATFVMGCIGFLFIYGDMVLGVPGFGGLIGLSLALNHGICRPRPLERKVPVPARPPLPFPARPAFSR